MKSALYLFLLGTVFTVTGALMHIQHVEGAGIGLTAGVIMEVLAAFSLFRALGRQRK